MAVAKDARTIVCKEQGEFYLNTTGNSGMATAGRDVYKRQGGIGHFGVDLGDAGFQLGNLFFAFFQVVFFLAESCLSLIHI